MSRKVFLIMKFEESFYELQENLIEEFSDFEFINVGEIDSQKNILQDIIDSIYKADVVLADLTGLNPNVFYELGIAHSFNKRVIQITQNIEELPFDIKQYRTLEYGTNYTIFKKFIKKLRPLLESVVEGEDLFSNPINDFLKKSDNLDLNTIRKKNIIAEEFAEEDKGFLDYLSDMEESMNLFTEDVEFISSGISELGIKMNKATDDIERVNKNGGSGGASFVKKRADKISRDIDELVEIMDESNKMMIIHWQKVEFSVLGLIDSKFMTESGNKNEMINFLRELLNFKNIIHDSEEKILSYKESINSMLGASRSLSKSARNLSKSTETYIEGTRIILDSLEKIDRKSRFLTSE